MESRLENISKKLNAFGSKHGCKNLGDLFVKKMEDSYPYEMWKVTTYNFQKSLLEFLYDMGDDGNHNKNTLEMPKINTLEFILFLK